MKKLKLSIVVLLFFAIMPMFGQNHELRLQLEGKEYEKLFLSAKLIQGGAKIDGQKNENGMWVFSIPDSIYTTIRYYGFHGPEGFRGTESYDKKIHYISLFSIHQDDTLKAGQNTIDKNVSEIHARYSHRYTHQAQVQSFLYDEFEIPYTKGSEHTIQAESFLFGSFYDYHKEKKGLKQPSYNEFLDEYIALVQKYPDSRYLIGAVFAYLDRYRSKDDVRSVYNGFSKDNKATAFGKRIEIFLSFDNFQNMTLPTYDTGLEENIVLDDTKYTLVIFSASWCAPCHKQIPLLKQIYQDLGATIDLVYVSTDEARTADNWRQMVKKEGIPWRSLMAVDKLKEINEKYFVESIPYCLLVAPDKTVEKIDVRKNEDKEKLYQLAATKSNTK